MARWSNPSGQFHCKKKKRKQFHEDRVDYVESMDSYDDPVFEAVR